MSCRALSLTALPGYWILSCLSKVSFAQSAEWAHKTEFSGLKSCFLFSLLGLYVHGCDSQAPFGESGKTVTSADIHEFFEDFNQKRRRRNWHFEAIRDYQTHWSIQNGVFFPSFQCYMLLLRYLEHIFCIWYPWEGNGLKTNLVLFKFSNLLLYEALVIVTMGTKLKQIHSRADLNEHGGHLWSPVNSVLMFSHLNKIIIVSALIWRVSPMIIVEWIYLWTLLLSPT